VSHSQDSFEAFAERLATARILPVISIDAPDHAVPLARALVEGGLSVLEITLRTPAALDAISSIAEEIPDALVGAGTIIRPEQFDEAAHAGARFAVAPGATESLYRAGRATDMPFLPAVATASDILLGLEYDYRLFKFFPAARIGGPDALRDLGGPFPEVGFVPTGGIRADTAGDYLQLDNVTAIGGSWMVPGEAVSTGDWSRITALADTATRIAMPS
jgi:2-dehydro-3-deoxyphosphogluconate aldolase/(4S)-4-hydroxy-2-oxoglutarate aldolase